MLPSVLKPAEKRALDLIADWPWLSPPHLGALIELERSRLAEVIARLGVLGLGAQCALVQRQRRLVLTDRALAMIARRDRASVGAARSRWSAAPGQRSKTGALSLAGAAASCSGTPSTTGAVHWFIAVLASAGALPISGDRPARPAPPRVPLLPPPRAVAFHPAPTPSASCARQGPCPSGILPRMGASRRATRDDGVAARALPALLLIPAADR